MFSLVEKCTTKTRAWNAKWLGYHTEFQEGAPFSDDDPNTYPVKNALLYCFEMIHRSERYDFSLNLKDISIPLPVNCELYILLNQLENVLSLLRNERDRAEIDFFEQGYTFHVYLSKTDNNVQIRVEEPPKTRTVQVYEGELAESFSRFLLEFLAAVVDVVPLMMKEPAFEKWFREILLRLKSDPRP